MNFKSFKKSRLFDHSFYGKDNELSAESLIKSDYKKQLYFSKIVAEQVQKHKDDPDFIALVEKEKAEAGMEQFDIEKFTGLMLYIICKFKMIQIKRGDLLECEKMLEGKISKTVFHDFFVMESIDK